MDDEKKNKKELIEEIAKLRKEISRFEDSQIEQKAIEMKILSDKHFFRKILDGIINGVWVTDKDDVIFYANKGMGKIAGIQSQQIIGARVLKDFPKETLKFFKPHYLNSRNNLHPVNYEAIPIITPAGRQSYQSGWLIPIIKEGQFDGMICTVDDITERKKSVEALQESEMKYRALIESSTEHVFMLDRDGVYIMSNNQTQQFGLHDGLELVGQRLEDVFSPELASFYREKLMEVISTKSAVEFEHPLLDQDGEHFHHDTLYPIFQNGKLSSIGGICRDITERKKAEDKIRESESKYMALFMEAKRFRDALDKVPSYVYMKDIHSRYIYANQLTLDLFKCSAKELIGCDDSEFFPPDTVKHLLEIDSRVFNGETTNEEIDALDEKGKGSYYLEVKSPIVEEPNSNKIVGLVGISTDITERKKTEEIIKNSLKENTILLKEIHHRVKNNLQIISSLLDLQADTLENDELRKFYNVSQNRIKSMALIHETLYKGLDLGSVNITEYLTELVDHLAASMGSLGDDVTIHVENSEVYLNIDTAIPIGLILNELISNCYKHAFPLDSGSIQDNEKIVEIKIGSVDENRYSLNVKDNGVGLPESIDFQESSTLGLQLIEMLVQQLHGSIEIDRKHGTEFKIIFKGRNVSTLKDE